MKKLFLCVGAALCSLFLAVNSTFAQGTAFTYQGQLQNNGSPANGLYDFEFSLSNAPSGGSQVGSTVTKTAVGVTNGLFTTTLDFGPVFTGNATWLGISVRTSGVGSYIGLSTNQELTPTPYAIYAPNAGNATTATTAGSANSVAAANIAGSIGLAQLPAALVTNNETVVTLGGTFSGNGAGLNNLNATDLSSGVVPTGVLPGFQSSDNYATVGGGLGNNAEGGAYSYTTIGGGNNNNNAGVATTIGGGQNNTINGTNASISTCLQATVGGGFGNTASASYATISGGENNLVNGYWAAISGGQNNDITSSSSYATIGGGGNNTNSASYATIPGGYQNVASGQYCFAAGQQAQATNQGAFVWADAEGTPFGSTTTNQFNVRANGGVRLVTSGAGLTVDGQPVLTGNQASPSFGTVTAGSFQSGNGDFIAGTGNSATGPSLTLGGGSGNTIIYDANGESTISGGQGNQIQADYATIGGGQGNNAGIGTGFYMTIGGGQDNNANGQSSTIGGGDGNNAGGLYATVGGGQGNTASGPGAFVGSGVTNTASGQWAAIGGGYLNIASGTNATVAGGWSNLASTNGATVGGGRGNAAIGGFQPTVSGGYENIASANYATVSGGFENTASANYATVAGGHNNTNSGISATISGGQYNIVSGTNAAVAGGAYNYASGPGSFVGGGGYNGNSYYGNFAGAAAAAVGGGMGNQALGPGSFIGGGGYDGNSYYGNFATGAASVIGGGYDNTASNSYATIGGGEFNVASGPSSFVGACGYDGINLSGNTASGAASVIGGGLGNHATNTYAAVLGGANNIAGGEYSLAAGQQAQALNQGAFVWADSQNATFSSTANDQFLVRAQGGVGINMNNPNGASLSVQGNQTGGFGSPVVLFQNINTSSGDSPALRVVNNGSATSGALTVSSQNPHLTGLIAEFGNSNAFVVAITNDGTIYAKAFTLTSDRNAKENFTALDAETVLARVAAMPVTEWNYKDDGADRKHIGPMAQDFQAAFGLNGGDDKHISMVDEGGVALAAIQGLNQKLNEKDAEIQDLKKSVDELKMMVQSLTQQK